MRETRLETFINRVRKGPDCWRWDGAHFSNGYAETWDGGRPRGAHRVAYELWVGPIPEGAVIDHLCNNRGCVNPAHLRATTHQKNILRGNGTSAKHARKTHCDYGHEFTEGNTHIDSRGRRNCRACYRRRNRESRTACPQGHEFVEGSYIVDALGRRRCRLCLPTHCKRGHAYTDENTYWTKDGGERQCRQCHRERAARRRAASKA